jgi:hypothetical protein
VESFEVSESFKNLQGNDGDPNIQCRGPTTALPGALLIRRESSMEVRRENNTEWVKRSLLYKEYSAELKEILLHKWIESEKAGYDIGFERALVDWHLKYRSIWHAKRMRLLYGQESQDGAPPGAGRRSCG